MRILAIETSCDDTSIALVEAPDIKKFKKNRKALPGFLVHEQIISSQTAIHRHWGGVVPNLAKREHIKNLPKIWRQIKKNNKAEADLIAVTIGPGLEPALWAGIEFAKKLSKKLNIPLVGANHLEGHLYSFLLQGEAIHFEFPAIVLLVSGGHTMLLLMQNMTHWEKLGETRDDAVGEAFDKVARMLALPYPGGPEIEKLVLSLPKKSRCGTINFPRPMMQTKDYDFSFSGLKTAVLYYIKLLKVESDELKADVAASFQAAAIDVLAQKTLRAVRGTGAKSIVLCGGVAANKALREELQGIAEKTSAQFFAPAFEYNTDNAAMIGVAAYMQLLKKKKKLPIEADGNLSL